MNKKDALIKAVAIRSDLVMLCQQAPDPDIGREVENIIPVVSRIITQLDRTDSKASKNG